MTKYFLFNNANRAANYGIGTYVKQMADCLKELGPRCELNLIDIYADVNEFTQRKEANGIKHYFVPRPKRQGCTLPYYRYIIFLSEYFIEADEPVIFHFNNDKHFGLMKLLKAKYPKCHIIYTVHYLDWCFALGGNVTRFRKILTEDGESDERSNDVRDNFARDKRLFLFCDEIIVLSRFAYELLKKDYGIGEAKLHLIYNGMREKQRGAKYDEGNLSTQTILFVGRLDEIKGIEFIIRAFKKVSMRMSDVRLTLVGDGDFCRYLSYCDGIWDKVTFTGKVANEMLETLYRQATIGVQPSFHEQCSYSAIEMMAYGIPLIATDSTGLREMMDKTPENMLRIKEENFNEEEFIDRFADMMVKLLSDSERKKRASLSLRRLFLERYSMDRMRESMGNLLDTIGQKQANISTDFLIYLDKEMARLVNERPLIDMDSIGLVGVGCYLWWRIRELEKRQDVNGQIVSAQLQEYMIYYIDWLFDVITMDGEKAFPPTFKISPLKWLFKGLLVSGFYKTRVYEIKKKLHSLGIDLHDSGTIALEDEEIKRIALMIYNSSF